MNIIKVRKQTLKSQSVSTTSDCKWVEMQTDDIKIVIDGSKRNNSLSIVVEANGIRYMLTDSLLELMLGKVAEEYSNEFLTFNAYQIDG